MAHGSCSHEAAISPKGGRPGSVWKFGLISEGPRVPDVKCVLFANGARSTFLSALRFALMNVHHPEQHGPQNINPVILPIVGRQQADLGRVLD